MNPSCEATPALPCWLEVDLDAIAANVHALQRWVGPQTCIAAVVKADAYGAGAEQVALTVVDAGARWLAVARVHEAEPLRKAGVRVPILVMNRTEPTECAAAARLGLTVTVDSIELGCTVARAAQHHGTPARVHVKIDTGLHRFGVMPNEALPLARALSTIPNLDVEGLYTHFASADEPDQRFTSEQLDRFQRTSAALAAAGYDFSIRHAANSAGTLARRDAHLDLVRVGLSLYGVSPSGSVPPGLELRPSLALRARIARISEVPVGEGVGYGQTWHAIRPARVALVTAGYADGIARRASNRGAVLVDGQRAPIIGRVSMDQTTIDVTDIPCARVGDTVTFFGRDGEAQIDLAEFAQWCDGIPHDALTGVGGRVARIYRRQGVPAGVQRLNGAIPLS